MDRDSNDRPDVDAPRTPEGERLHDREDMSARDGMASTDDSPVERGERQAHTGGGADRDAWSDPRGAVEDAEGRDSPSRPSVRTGAWLAFKYGCHSEARPRCRRMNATQVAGPRNLPSAHARPDAAARAMAAAA